MSEAAYDQINDFYLRFVDFGLENRHSLFYQGTRFLLEMLDDLEGKTILDLCCGEGHFSNMMAERGGRVTGLDLSQVNIEAARSRFGQSHALQFAVNDAQTLKDVPSNHFDLAVCKMALMDIPDAEAAFQALARVLKPGGQFVASLLHPCFETPFTVPFQPIEQDQDAQFAHHRVQRYFEEGHWSSGGSGVRGHVGAHHRKLSTYLNLLQRTGFQILRLEEPQLNAGETGTLESQWSQHIPRMLFWQTVLQ